MDGYIIYSYETDFYNLGSLQYSLYCSCIFHTLIIFFVLKLYFTSFSYGFYTIIIFHSSYNFCISKLFLYFDYIFDILLIFLYILIVFFASQLQNFIF